MTTRHVLVALSVAGLVAAPAATALSPIPVGTIAPGAVDPWYGDTRAVGATHVSLVRAWGRPVRPAEDVPVAVWRDGLEVTLTRAPAGRAVKFHVTGPLWRTPAGVTVGTTESRLRRVYRGRLVAVADRRGILGVRRHWMVVRGRNAVGFVMRPGRVAAMVSGRTAVVRADLAFAGPL
jgi:hypothetical protein